MTRHVESFREKGLLWLLGLDTRLSEFTLGCASIINGVQVVTPGRDGHSLAPFLDSAFAWLSNDHYWVLVLAFVGVARLFSLSLGMARNNCYLLRAIVSLVDAIMWLCIVAAIVTGPQVPLAAGRFMLASMVSAITALVLFLRHDVAKDKTLRELWPDGALERRADARR